MKYNILITGIGGGGVGRQIIKALKMSELTLNLFGSDTTTQSYGKEDVDEFLILPQASDEKYISDLLDKCDENNIKVLFPGSESELIKISEAIEEFNKANIYVPINSTDLINNCLDKFSSNEFLLINGFHCPRSVSITKIEEINNIDFFPAVLKPSSGAGGSTNVFIVQNKQELSIFSNYLLINDVNIIAQEYIGDYKNEYTVGVLCSEDKGVINSIVMKRNISSGFGHKLGVKNRTKHKELGDRLIISSGISQGKFIERSIINEVCEKIAVKLGATSTINIQGRLHKDEFYVFEINPRFSGTTSSRAVMGYNEPAILLNKKLFGKTIKPYFNYKKGRVYRGLNERLID